MKLSRLLEIERLLIDANEALRELAADPEIQSDAHHLNVRDCKGTFMANLGVLRTRTTTTLDMLRGHGWPWTGK